LISHEHKGKGADARLLHPSHAGRAVELETFMTTQREQGHEVPGFVEREFRAFLDCGVLARGSAIP
jgi:hypothetical protein